MDGKGNFLILLVIIAILTLTLAVLAGYLFIMSGAPKIPVEKPVQQTETAVEIPKASDLLYKQLYEERPGLFNLKNEGAGKMAVVQIEVELAYLKQVKGVKNTQGLVNSYINEIKEHITKYFLKMTITEASSEDAIEKTKNDLKDEINNLIKTREKIHRDIISNVIISKWNVQG